jgi:methylphosphotriester-DNA--protein-cysteine methyltransferase
MCRENSNFFNGVQDAQHTEYAGVSRCQSVRTSSKVAAILTFSTVYLSLSTRQTVKLAAM